MDEHTDDPSVDAPTGTPTGWNVEDQHWEHATLRRAVVHGIRLFNDGAYHEAHDCFEHEWYNYGAGTVESSFLHGMTQVAAGTYKHVDLEDDIGLQSLFRTALQYLEPVPEEFYGVSVDDISRQLERALVDPTMVQQWRIELDGEIVIADQDDYAYAESID